MHLRFLVPGAVAALATVALTRAAVGLPAALGAPAPRLRATADRAAAAGSRHASDGLFHNTLPDEIVNRGALLAVIRAMAARGTIGRPGGAIPLAADPAPPTPAPLALTWYGHSSVLLEVDGHRVLADPVWGERVSPSPTIGPRRLHPAPVPLSALPPVDAIVISHDHYDHLDLPTVRALLHAGDRAVRRPARARRPPAPLGRAGRPRRRAGLGRVGADRRADPDLHRGTALLRARAAPQHHALVVVGRGRAAAPRLLRRRHRLHPGVRRSRPHATARSTSPCCRSGPTATAGR